MGVTLLNFDFGPFWASTISMTIALARLFRKGVPEAASGAKFRDSQADGDIDAHRVREFSTLCDRKDLRRRRAVLGSAGKTIQLIGFVMMALISGALAFIRNGEKLVVPFLILYGVRYLRGAVVTLTMGSETKGKSLEELVLEAA